MRPKLKIFFKVSKFFAFWCNVFLETLQTIENFLKMFTIFSMLVSITSY